MKKIFWLFLVFFLSFNFTFAHPLDISSSFINFKGNKIDVTTFFHSYEIEYLLNNSWVKVKNIWEYKKNENIIINYLKENISLNIPENNCTIENIVIIESEEYEILTKWFEVNYSFNCEKEITKWELEVNFFNNFELQTNRVTFYDLNAWETTPFEYKILTPQISIYQFDLNNKTPICVVDSDWDGLSDWDEKLYKTDPNNIDSDWDFYTDAEEVNAWWYPADNNISPGQTFRETMPEYLKENAWKSIKTKKDCDKENEIFTSNNKSTWLLQSWFANEYFSKTIEKISNYLNGIWNYNFIYIFLIVVFLWFIHAAWPGHSKSLLISYILDKNKSFFDWFLFIVIFSITHLIDIVLLFLVVKFFFSMTNASNYMLYIQRFSIVILLLFSIYFIYKSFKNLKIESKETLFDKWVKWNILLWFVSWLVPCTFGWSIFLLLFSLWKIWLILPLIWALGLGIFIFLFSLLIIVYFFRKKAFERVDILSKYSQVISSSLIFVLSIYLMTQIF